MTAPVASMIPEQEVRDALAPHYILEKELGRGGMGAVYLARDVQFKRLRLELIRLRSGVGTAAEVKAEATRAKSLMAGSFLA